MKKNFYFLAGVFVVLFAAVVLVLQKPGEQSAESARTGLLAALDSASVDKIEIKSLSGSIAVEKKGAEWGILQPVQAKASQEYIAQIIHHIKNIEVISTVTDKPEKHALFQVDQSGTEVKICEHGTEKISFILGKTAATSPDSYARKLHTNDVLLVSGASGYMFTRPVKDWRDKTISAVPRETITSVRYQYGDTSFAVELRDSAWCIGSRPVKQSVVEEILTSLSNVQADDFIDSVYAAKGTTIVQYSNVQLRFSFNKPKNVFAVQSSQSNQWYTMGPAKANQILKRKKEIIE